MRSTTWSRWRRFGAGAAVVATAAVVLAAPGSLDTSYGSGGVASAAPAYLTPRGFAMQADGMSLVGGYQRISASSSANRWRIDRFTVGGASDPGFGSSGVVTLFGNAADDRLNDLAVDGAGRCVAVGTSTVAVPGKKPGSTTNVPTATVVRLLASGALDTSFGTGGVVRFSVPGSSSSSPAASSLTLQPDGRIVAAGTASFRLSGNTYVNYACVTRLLANGAIDTSFGSSGFAIDARAAINGVPAVRRQLDGRIVVAQGTGPADEGRITRFLADGGIDAGFAPIVSPGDTFLGMAVDRFDRIVATGRRAGVGVDAVALRYMPSGAVDSTFGVGGKVTLTGLYTHQSFGYARGAVFQADDKIVVSAVFATTPGSTLFDATAPVRLLDNGALDTTYGSGGVGAVLSFAPGDDYTSATGLGLDPAGATLLSGRANSASTSAWWFVARYLAQ